MRPIRFIHETRWGDLPDAERRVTVLARPPDRSPR